MNLDKLFQHLVDEHGLNLVWTEKRKIADCLPCWYSVGDVSTRFSRLNYDKRQLPPLYFTQDYSVKNIHLFLKGEEYTPYMFNYQRMIDLMNEGVLSENGTQLIANLTKQPCEP